MKLEHWERFLCFLLSGNAAYIPSDLQQQMQVEQKIRNDTAASGAG